MSLEYRLDGRKVSSEEWFKSLHDDALGGGLAEVQEKLESVVCPEHGQRPKVTMERTSEGATFNIEGCCDKLVETAQAAAS